jgi:AbrB family looped-hinge helix DNA binding protein
MLQMKMSEGGRVVVPVEIRRSLGLQEGDTVLFELRDGEAVLTTRKARLARARALFRQYVPEGSPSLADELITERRAEAARENARENAP